MARGGRRPIGHRIEKTCDYCGQTFQAYRKDQRFCPQPRRCKANYNRKVYLVGKAAVEAIRDAETV